MNKSKLLFLVLCFVVGCSSQKKATVFKSSENTAAVALKKSGRGWAERHQTILSRLGMKPELILVGNSIFHTLDNEDRKEVWTKYLNKYHTVNMGISGDRTENVIWRLQNGSLEKVEPKVAIVLIGTNNTDGNHYMTVSKPEQLAEGIWKICDIIGEKLPNTKILLMGILPYGYNPNHRNELNKSTNELISKFPGRNTNITYIDISPIYLNADGNVKKNVCQITYIPTLQATYLCSKRLKKKLKN
ncbi:GDSL-type esterase/lipase family protein [Kriegella aquimaris]|uniref:Lysophospholipase L1 n=1 Tax=Kriegella aquimaris TaxID=192904 RepID=A0A1G9VI60_9FLAO|nr:GDSL-type esterase/lipase family protein [Kriegella aquimaris]SDM71505.1 Lysophospholipase L1 [Kriegella aquimaris]